MGVLSFSPLLLFFEESMKKAFPPERKIWAKKSNSVVSSLLARHSERTETLGEKISDTHFQFPHPPCYPAKKGEKRLFFRGHTDQEIEGGKEVSSRRRRRRRWPLGKWRYVDKNSSRSSFSLKVSVPPPFSLLVIKGISRQECWDFFMLLGCGKLERVTQLFEIHRELGKELRQRKFGKETLEEKSWRFFPPPTLLLLSCCRCPLQEGCHRVGGVGGGCSFGLFFGENPTLFWAVKWPPSIH